MTSKAIVQEKTLFLSGLGERASIVWASLMSVNRFRVDFNIAVEQSCLQGSDCLGRRELVDFTDRSLVYSSNILRPTLLPARPRLLYLLAWWPTALLHSA